MIHSPPAWNIEDLIDLEYFIHLEESLPDGPEKEARHKKDRAFHLEQMRSHAGDKPVSRAAVLRSWLEFRRVPLRESHPHDHVLPGDAFRQLYAVMMLVMILTGFSSGSGLCFSFLVYRGSEPLNVSAYLGLFVLTQIALMAFFSAGLIVARFRGAFRAPSLIRLLLGSAMVRLSVWIRKKTHRHLNASQRNSFAAALGMLRGKSIRYSGVFPWPPIILTQVFAVWFNIGVLTATLLRIIGSDLAFGWQSTLQLSAAAVHKGVVWLALPWSRLVPEHIAHPSLAQIEGSRIILKDGIGQLSSPDLAAWWPFLCFSVLVYGLLPRIVFLTAAVVMKKRALRRVSFNSAAFDKLLLSLSSPAIETFAETKENGGPHDLPAPVPPVTAIEGLSHPMVVLVPDDIGMEGMAKDLGRHVMTLFRTPMSRSVQVCLDPDLDREKIDELISESQGRLALLMESWQPPIRETLQYILEIKSQGGTGFKLYLLMTGKPGVDNRLTPPGDTELTVWKEKIFALGDPDIRVEPIC